MIPVSIVVPIREINDLAYVVACQERVELGQLNGYYEFPGGKIEATETPAECAKRELREETGLEIVDPSGLKLFKIMPYDYEDRSVLLYIYLLSDKNSEMKELKEIEINYEKIEDQLSEKLYQDFHCQNSCRL